MKSFLRPVRHIILADNNQIKVINGGIFQKLTKLTFVDLGGNDCIDEDFEYPTRITAMLRIVTQKCGFDENVDRIPKGAYASAAICILGLALIVIYLRRNKLRPTGDIPLTALPANLPAAPPVTSTAVPSPNQPEAPTATPPTSLPNNPPETPPT